MDATQENELFAAAQNGDDQAWSELAQHRTPIMAAYVPVRVYGNPESLIKLSSRRWWRAINN